MGLLVRIWEDIKANRKAKLKGIIVWKHKDGVRYRTPFSDTWIAIRALNPKLLDRFKPFDVLKPALYMLQAEINKRISDMSSSDHSAIVPRLVWCPGPRINGVAKPDHHQRLVFVPTNLLAAMWLQFAQAVTGEYPLRTCEGCGEVFQVGKGARRIDAKTCGEARCRQRISRKKRAA